MNKQIINGEEITTLFENEKIRIETILSFGNSSPCDFWYCQDEDEWVLLTNGNAKIQFEDCEKHLCKDDHMLIPAYKKHRVSHTSDDAEWLCVFIK